MQKENETKFDFYFKKALLVFEGILVGMAIESALRDMGKKTIFHKLTKTLSPKSIELNIKTTAGSHKVQCIDNGKDSICNLTSDQFPTLAE